MAAAILHTQQAVRNWIQLEDRWLTRLADVSYLLLEGEDSSSHRGSESRLHVSAAEIRGGAEEEEKSVLMLKCPLVCSASHSSLAVLQSKKLKLHISLRCSYWCKQENLSRKSLKIKDQLSLGKSEDKYRNYHKPQRKIH